MANEAVKVYANSVAGDILQDFDIDDNTGLEKGRLLVLLDERKVSGCTTDNAVCAGILAREKIAGDGRTRVAVYRAGDFEMVAGTAITLGYPVASYCSTSGANVITQAGGTSSGAVRIGYALGTASAGETVQVRLQL